MLQLVFLIPFRAESIRLDELIGSIELVLTRTDDWDSQMGFRLLDEMGALRLFRLSETVPSEEPLLYEIQGTALTQAGIAAVSREFRRCLTAVQEISGKITERRLVTPPGIELVAGDERPDPVPTVA